MNRSTPRKTRINPSFPRKRESNCSIPWDSRSPIGAGDKLRGNDVTSVFRNSHAGHARFAARHTQKGVGLIEVLVAVLVLSIGLLGLAQLQAKSLSTNSSAMSRSMATMFSYSILDAMRIDQTNLGSYDGQKVQGPESNCPEASGSLAHRQLHQWCESLVSNLGDSDSTTGKIDCDANNVCTITITFDDSRAGEGGSSTQEVKTVAAL